MIAPSQFLENFPQKKRNKSNQPHNIHLLDFVFFIFKKLWIIAQHKFPFADNKSNKGYEALFAFLFTLEESLSEKFTENLRIFLYIF